MMRVKVERKWTEAEGVVAMDLVPVSGAMLPAFEAGAHIDLWLPNGIIRQYSLCNSPQDTGRYQIAVSLDANSRGGSRAVHQQVSTGDILQISAPRNLFALSSSAKRSVLFAGGIGITPIIAMAEALSQAGQDFSLHYFTRSEARTPFKTRLQAADFASRVTFHCGEGAVLREDWLLDALALPDDATHLYACGPEGFMVRVTEAANTAEWQAANLHTERFSAVSTSEGDTAFSVRLARSGKCVRVTGKQTVVEALAIEGVDVPTSCEQGICGTCVTRVIAGEVDHRDSYFTKEERARHDQFLPCCSRAKSEELVLDL